MLSVRPLGETETSPSCLGTPTPIDDNCSLPHRGADPYIGCMCHSHKFPRRFREGGNLASQLHADDRECNEMQPNATVLKVSPLLATPDEANVATNEATPGTVPTSKRCAERGHPGLISSLAARSKWSQKSQIDPLFENFMRIRRSRAAAEKGGPINSEQLPLVYSSTFACAEAYNRRDYIPCGQARSATWQTTTEPRRTSVT